MNNYIISIPKDFDIRKSFTVRDEKGKIVALLHVDNTEVCIKGTVSVAINPNFTEKGENKVF